MKEIINIDSHQPVTVTDKAIAEDKPRISAWKRNTEEIINMLKERKESLPYGKWGQYLDGIGMNRMTAHRYLNPVQEHMAIDTGNVDVTNVTTKLDYHEDAVMSGLKEVRDSARQILLASMEMKERKPDIFQILLESKQGGDIVPFLIISGCEDIDKELIRWDTDQRESVWFNALLGASEYELKQWDEMTRKQFFNHDIKSMEEAEDLLSHGDKLEKLSDHYEK